MKFRARASFKAATLLAVLVLPLQVLAQQPRYKFVDIPTLGGPNPDGSGVTQVTFTTNPGMQSNGPDWGTHRLFQ